MQDIGYGLGTSLPWRVALHRVLSHHGHLINEGSVTACSRTRPGGLRDSRGGTWVFTLPGGNVHKMKGSCLLERLHDPEGETEAMEPETQLRSGSVISPQATLTEVLPRLSASYTYDRCHSTVFLLGSLLHKDL